MHHEAASKNWGQEVSRVQHPGLSMAGPLALPPE
jgi:hypothetical protein